MNKQSILLTVTALVLGGLIMAPGLVGAYQGDLSVQGPGCTGERHEAMEQAFGNGDHNAWKELVSGKGGVTQVVTEENFVRFAEAHELAKEGRMDEARQIRQGFGLGLDSRNGDR